MTSGMRLPLYWRVCLINGLLFVVGTMALAFLPVTVSARVLVSEAIVLVLGLAAIVGLNSLLLRTSLAPLDRLVQETTRAGLDEVREVARRLRPGVLEDLGLHNALAALATEFSSHGMRVRRVTSPGLAPVAPETELVIYRVAQEALTNAARHSGATEVEVSLLRQGTQVVLIVEDNGRMDGLEEGAGIRGMRERALLVGGELRIERGQRGGVRVELRVS